MSTQRQRADEVLSRCGRTWAQELGIDLARGTPAPLFQFAVFSLLASARIGTDTAVQAARALFDQGWTTARKMDASTWRQRTNTLNRSGYARYDESTSRMLGDSCALLLERWGGDLRRLREEAERDPERERALLKELKGIGDVGCDIFLREVQQVWDELYPFADDRVLRLAPKVGLPDDPKRLARLVPRKDLPRLLAGLLRLERADLLAEVS